MDGARQHTPSPPTPDARGIHQEENKPSHIDVEAHPYLLPARWWFASTAFPLLAGTFGPMASAFSICALSQPWRAYLEEVPTGKRPHTVKDPKWLKLPSFLDPCLAWEFVICVPLENILILTTLVLRVIAINSISLGSALISNLSLLLNMARRLSFPVAQPITIGGWFIASILLICLTAIMPRVTDMQGFQLTQAYYYAIMAAAVYLFISSLLLVTAYGAITHKYKRDFHLTSSQRSVMLQTIMYMVYLLGGAAGFSQIEGWSFLDGVYWADFTLLTDGIGDLAPLTHTGRSLLLPYAVGGILTLALVVGSIRSLMVERGRNKLIARTTERTRRSVTNAIRSGSRMVWIKSALKVRNREVPDDERKEMEFYLMRRIHKISGWKQKWISLLVALIAWSILWFVGAVAFWMAEQGQEWSYFTSLYFAYTNLLTIGYGDVVLKEMWAKPFFVLWSLLAIPTMTILISSMGDTIAEVFYDATILTGELTILPDEAGFRHTFIGIFRKAAQLILWKKNYGPDAGDNGDQPNASEKDRLEKSNANEKPVDTNDPDIPPYDRYKRWRVLIREIKKVYHDISESPGKEYTYDEWCFYLELVGLMDSCSSYIDIPVNEAEISRPKRVGLLTYRPPGPGSGNKWSWIGLRSPLMGDKDEAEWLFEALSSRLEQEIKTQRDICQSDPGAQPGFPNPARKIGVEDKEMAH